MQKIAIIVSGGSGKSTLAVRLARCLGIPVYHLDALFWQPGWVETEGQRWVEVQQSLCKKSAWIIDGNYSGTMEIRLNACDTVIFLDRNRYLCLYRAMRRSLLYRGRSRPDMAAGCNERFDFDFLKWIFNYPNKKRSGILDKLQTLKGTHEIHILKSQKDIDSFVNRCCACIPK